MNKQQLAAKIWASANKMRSKNIETNEYKDYILGFIFYKFLSDKEVKYLKDSGWNNENIKEYLKEEDKETVDDCQYNLGYFIDYNNLFSTWIDNQKDFTVSNVRDALSAFNRMIADNYKHVYDKIFDTLQMGLSKLGDSTGSQTKSVLELITLIEEIPTDGKEDYDVLGFIYENLISNFAANAGKKAGEFYTPHEVSLLMSELVAYHLRGRKEIEIYDPTSGSGSLLINIGRSVAKHIENKDNIKYYAQELKENTYNLTRMNLVMRNIKPSNIEVRNGDTLEDDWPWFDEKDPENTYKTEWVDAVVSNPPYSQNWTPHSDERFDEYGIAPKTKADYAFLLHDLYHLKTDGIITIVLPHGVLFRGGEEEKIRKNLIEHNNIDAIIGLPANIFFGTGIPTIVMVLRKNRPNTDVLIIDASQGFVKDGKNNRLRACDIKRVVDAYIERECNPKFSGIPGFARKVEKKVIAEENGYNLNIPRYVSASDNDEQWDIYATMFGGIPKTEIDILSDYWEAFPSLRSELFKNEHAAYTELNVTDIDNTISNNKDVIKFNKAYTDKFSTLTTWLDEELIENVMQVKTEAEENVISDNIFSCFNDVDLVNRYQAYQLLDDQWQTIATDIEILQTEGWDAVRKVDTAKIIKKNKKGDEKEVVDGILGHVIPIELAEKFLLKEDYDSLQKLYAESERLVEQQKEIFETFTDEEKDSNCFNDDKSDFVAAEVKKSAKEFSKSEEKYDEDSYEVRIMDLNNNIELLKQVNQRAKTKKESLTKVAVNAIENLSDEDARKLLHLKWISPLYAKLVCLPIEMEKILSSKISDMANKYIVTYHDIEQRIETTSSSLAEMIGELQGDEFDMKGMLEFQKYLKK